MKSQNKSVTFKNLLDSSTGVSVHVENNQTTMTPSFLNKNAPCTPAVRTQKQVSGYASQLAYLAVNL